MNTISKSIGAFDAKTHLSQYLDDVEKGERIEITRRGKPVAILVSPDLVYPKTVDVDQVIRRVQERRVTYKIGSEEISEWKAEGRA